VESKVLVKEWVRSILGPGLSARLGAGLRYWMPRIDYNLFQFEQGARRLLGGRVGAVYSVAQIDPVKSSNGLARMAMMGVVDQMGRRSDITGLKARFDDIAQTEHFNSSDLMFSFGKWFLKAHEVNYAMQAFSQFVRLDQVDGKFHVGRVLLDYINDEPSVPCLLAVLDGFASVEAYEVPDLVAGMIASIETANKNFDSKIELPEELYQALPPFVLNNMGDKLLGSGDANGALPFYLRSIRKIPHDILLRLQVGVTYFLAGRYKEAERHWNILAATRKNERTKLGIGNSGVRILGESFFVAIGHTAYIDTYIKAVKLGWRQVDRIIAPISMGKPMPGQALMGYLSKYVEQVPYAPGQIDSIVHKIGLESPLKANDNSVEIDVRISTTDDFWYGPSADGNVRWFAPHGADVEREWRARDNGPLFSISEEETALFRASMEQVFGLPRDAWFVGLHVRTPGYHQKWHDAHPGTRNAEIETYKEVIDWIIEQGGWVVRLGDHSMPPYVPHERVIDYATSEFRSPDIDIMLCATCAYFLGTNSGLSVVPAIFGRPCALTNWSPIAIPNWYIDDVYVPKLVRETATGRLLTFREMFSSMAGWSQFAKDYKKAGLEIVENDAEDLLDATIEVHEAYMGRFVLSVEEQAMIDRFNEIAVAHEGFVGSRISARFLKRYKHLMD
tara:strand:+ start:32127 stop:34148 length:2022 start_codon:yes stop_codon:yes gene_type:complete